MDKNFVLIIKCENSEVGYLTNTPDLAEALNEFTEKRIAQLENQSKHFTLPLVKEAKLYRIVE